MIPPGRIEEEARRRKPKPLFDYAMVAELSVLHELSSLAFAETEDRLAQESIEKATRLFGVRGFALLCGEVPEQRLAVCSGYRSKPEVLARMASAGAHSNCLALAFNEGTEDQDVLFFEQMRPIDERARRLYAVFARRIEDRLAAFRAEDRRRRAERDAAGHHDLLRAACRVAGLGGWCVDLEARALCWSDETAVLHERPPGHSPEPEEAWAHCVPEWRGTVERAFAECAAEGTGFDLDGEVVGAKGGRRRVRIVGEAVRAPAGRIVKVQGAVQALGGRA